MSGENLKVRKKELYCLNNKFFLVLLTVFICQLSHIGHFLILIKMFFDAAQIGYNVTFRLSLSHEFEHFGSLFIRAPRKDIGRSGTRTRYARALSEPRYQ